MGRGEEKCSKKGRRDAATPVFCPPVRTVAAGGLLLASSRRGGPRNCSRGCHRVQLLRAGVPQLLPAGCFAYVLEKDMALSFGNHSSAQWVQQGANTCETPTGAAPSPFLKHFFCFLFVCLHSGKPTAGLFDPIFSLHHTHIKHYNSV